VDSAEDNDAMPQILGSSVSYRIAVGPQQGRKAFMIRTIRPLESPDPGLERVAKANGFSLHAGVSCEGHQKDKRERVYGDIHCRGVLAMPVSVVGVDLSKSVFQLSVADAKHRVVDRKRLNRSQFHRFLARKEPVRLVVEHVTAEFCAASTICCSRCRTSCGMSSLKKSTLLSNVSC
jgi:hypothetical protein